MIRERIIIGFILLALVAFQTTLLAVPSGKSISWEDGDQGVVTFEGRACVEKLLCDANHPV